LIVYGLKVDGVVQTSEQAEGRSQALNPRVGQRHAVADAGRSKLLAFDDFSHNDMRGETHIGRNLSGELLKQATLVPLADIDHDMSRREEIADVHEHRS
jgi:hypothetical protein